MFIQTDVKNKRKQNTQWKQNIDKNKIVQWLGDTFGVIPRLAAEWRRIPSYDVIWNMAGSNKRWRQRRFEPSQEKDVLKKIINGNVSSELILLWLASVYGASSIQFCVSPLVLRLQKVQER